MTTSLDSRLRDVQALLNSLLEESREPVNAAPSHWELPILPPPDVDGRLSSTDLLNWWFRAPQSRGQGMGVADPPQSSAIVRRSDAGGEEAPHLDGWSELSVLFPEPEEHLADEHAQGAVDCVYEFLHAVGQRDVRAASDLIDDAYHTIEMGVEVDKATFTNGLLRQVEELSQWNFEVSLAVAPEPVSHPFGVLMHVIIQFDAESRADGTKRGRVERRVAILRQDRSGSWRITGMPKVGR